MMYHPVTDKLPTFDARLRDGICLCHERGGVYTFLTVDGAIRKKHFRAIEDEFPGLSFFDATGAESDSTVDDIYLDIKS